MTTHTWNNTTGTWTDTGSWNPNGVPGADDSALLAGTNTYTVTIDDAEAPGSVTLDNANASLSIDTGGVLLPGVDLDLIAGTLGVAGVVGPGTVIGNGGTLAGDGGTLDGVSWVGDALSLTGGSDGGQAFLNIDNGFSVERGGGGAGTFMLGGNATQVNFLDDEILSAMTIDIVPDPSVSITTGDGTTLTVAGSTSVQQTGTNTAFDISGDGTLINDGAFVLQGGSGSTDFGNGASTFNLAFTEFDNANSFAISNTETAIVQNTTFDNTGSLALTELSSFTFDFGGALDNDGQISLSASSLLVSSTDDNDDVLDITGAGTIALADHSKVTAGNIDGTVQFADATGTLAIETAALSQAGTLTGTIDGFVVGDKVDLLGMQADKAVWQGGTLVVTDQGAQVFALNLGGSYNGEFFQAQSDGGTGTNITLLPCFAAGTAIRTRRGDVPVEALRVGDAVLTRRGRFRPVVWIGHRRIDCRRHRRPQDVLPVRVRAGAFGAGRPQRDLLLSPDHAVFTGGVLIPIRYLLNGRAVAQEDAAEITYFHVELPSHDVILAEGLRCESFLDTGNRGAFEGGAAAVQLHPDFALSVWRAKACAPLVREGGALAAARGRLIARAARLGHATTGDPGLRVLAGGRAFAAEAEGCRYRIALPGLTGTVRLVSRVWRPAQMRPAETDTRPLGVAIARLWLDGREASLDSPALGAGWHRPEPGWRWTDGNAELALSGVGELVFEVAIAGTYWRDEPGGEVRAA